MMRDRRETTKRELRFWGVAVLAMLLWLLLA